MKRLACILFFALSIVAQAQERPAAGPPPPPSAKPAATQPAVKIAGLGQERHELTLRECFRLSLSTVNAVAAAVELQREGVITVDTDRSIASAWVLDRLAAKHPEIDLETPEFIDRMREWIEANNRFILNALKKQGT